MTSVVQTATGSAPQPPTSAPRSPRRRPAANGVGYLFLSGYVVLLIAFGVFPAGYAIELAFTNDRGQFVGFGNFTRVFSDFRFGPSLLNVAIYLVIWLALLVVLCVGLALLLHGRARRASNVLRFLFYLPGALAGVASILVWLFVLDPNVSPFSSLLHLMGFDTFGQAAAPAHLHVIFALIAFWTGAGGWILVMHGALNNISTEVLEAARIDGASRVQTAVHIQIPLIRKWIAYMVVLAFAAGTQIFVEPQIVGTATLGGVSSTWSPNQLAYVYAFQNSDFHGSAAISVFLLLVGIACAAVVVFKSGLFEVE